MDLLTADSGTRVASSISTGGGGYEFEHQVAALMATLMICDGELVFAPRKKIVSISFQNHAQGRNLDDIELCLVGPSGKQSRSLIQSKRTIKFVKSDSDFVETIQAAWSDYNSSSFDKSGDCLVLATGPLRETDRGLLDYFSEKARACGVKKFADELRNKVGLSQHQIDFYNLLLEIMGSKTSNLNDEQVVAFLSRFYLFVPDSVYGTNLTVSFACSLLNNCFDVQNGLSIFRQIKSKVEETAPLAGILDKEELLGCLDLGGRSDSDAGPRTIRVGDLNLGAGHLTKAHVALLSLIGAWNESATNDRAVVCAALGVDDESLDLLVARLRDVTPSLIQVKGGVARVLQRRTLWRSLAGNVSKRALECFLDEIVRNLSQIDLALSAPPDERVMISADKHGFSASNLLREGFSKGLALLAADIDYCNQISCSERNSIPCRVLKRIFADHDWHIWATLDGDLQYLAEVEPSIYMSHVRSFFRRTKGGIKALFSQETRGIWCRSYIVGLVNSLGVLAWFPESMAEAMHLLAEMAQCDPDGQCHPRPIDILQDVLHPLAPHTWADAKMRVVVLKSILRNVGEETAWKIGEALLPNGQYSYIEGSLCPLYRTKGRSAQVGHRKDTEEVWREFDQYAEFIIEKCSKRSEYLASMIKRALDHWGQGAFDALVKKLGNVRKKLNSKESGLVWSSVHEELEDKRFEEECGGGIDWNSPRLKAYCDLERQYMPSDARIVAKSLFSWRNHRDEEKLLERRTNVIRNIYEDFGVDGFLDFAKEIDQQGLSGSLLAKFDGTRIDPMLLPRSLMYPPSETNYAVVGYVQERFAQGSWAWVDGLDMKGWDKKWIATLLTFLPFSRLTWACAGRLLGDDESLYWCAISHVYLESDDDLEEAVNGLLRFGRAYVALDLTGHRLVRKHPVDVRILRGILKNMVLGKVDDEPTSMTHYNLPEAIKAIQDCDDVPDSEKARIEWAFIDMVDWASDRGFRPEYLGRALAGDPEFFCEALSVVYLTGKETKENKTKKAKRFATKQDEHRVTNVWRLLDHWRHVPGSGPDGSFDGSLFKRWTRKVFSQARKLDRLIPAQIVLGQMLIHAPRDPDGFWMHRVIADFLCKRGNERMLENFRMAKFNSRGVHSVDPTGKADRKLAEDYDQLAISAETEGYIALGRKMRQLAATYRQEAEEIVEEHELLDDYFKTNKEECRGAV